jgi:hypothetical protein
MMANAFIGNHYMFRPYRPDDQMMQKNWKYYHRTVILNSSLTAGVPTPAEAIFFFSPQHPEAPMGTRNSFPGGKAAGE